MKEQNKKSSDKKGKKVDVDALEFDIKKKSRILKGRKIVRKFKGQ